MKHALGTIAEEKDIENIRTHFGFDKFVGEFQSPINGEISTSGMLFWQKEIPEETYKRVKNPNDVSNYAFVFRGIDGRLWIRNGLPWAEKKYTGKITPNGDFIYSRSRHDCVIHDDCMIDGGEDYVRSFGKGELVDFHIKDGEIVLGED
jgi:hypothetical protein